MKTFKIKIFIIHAHPEQLMKRKLFLLNLISFIFNNSFIFTSFFPLMTHCKPVLIHYLSVTLKKVVFMILIFCKIKLLMNYDKCLLKIKNNLFLIVNNKIT